MLILIIVAVLLNGLLYYCKKKQSLAIHIFSKFSYVLIKSIYCIIFVGTALVSNSLLHSRSYDLYFIFQYFLLGITLALPYLDYIMGRMLGWSKLKSILLCILAVVPLIAFIPFIIIMCSSPKRVQNT